MKRKRLSRDVDSWGFEASPYWQFRMDCEEFHGLAGLIRITGKAPQYWTSPKAGRYQVSGTGMYWLQLVPDGAHHVITVMMKPEPKTIGGVLHPYSVSAWYVDVIESWDYDEDGTAFFIDKYLDVIATPQGDIKVDDRDELDAAYASGELTETQYLAALYECDVILQTLCADLSASEAYYTSLFEETKKYQ